MSRRCSLRCEASRSRAAQSRRRRDGARAAVPVERLQVLHGRAQHKRMLPHCSTAGELRRLIEEAQAAVGLSADEWVMALIGFTMGLVALALEVDRRRRLVHEQHARRAHQRARHTEQLPLPDTQVAATLVHGQI